MEGLDHAAITQLTAYATDTTPTNRSYRRGQQLFCQWAFDHDIDINNFSRSDLLNFLTAARSNNYSLNTLKLFKSAILKFHHHPAQFHNDVDIVSLFKKFAIDSPPVPLGKPPIDLSPTFKYIIDIYSQAALQLKLANHRAAFLLGITGLLRPSDLHRIKLQQCSISQSGCLTLVISHPKERRGGRPIIKHITIHPHCTQQLFCPVHAFKILCDHPQACNHRPPDILFVDCNKPQIPVQLQTISKWLINLVRRSTDIRPTPSVRSLGTDLAIKNGIPLDDVVTLGNWSSAALVENHYCRERLTQTNATHFILTSNAVQDI
ncbi:hypothetical protein INT45_013284 [Circinella minor]|uniref:Integrase SAM-like N-terminal domain-containing protein n=1 Tax=Circinella minor TaxID=1195481 RepID=A0A8H7VA75_9FUNG|nr:hypothetical protein INT45_013284 [Circinella minor]